MSPRFKLWTQKRRKVENFHHFTDLINGVCRPALPPPLRPEAGRTPARRSASSLHKPHQHYTKHTQSFYESRTRWESFAVLARSIRAFEAGAGERLTELKRAERGAKRSSGATRSSKASAAVAICLCLPWMHAMPRHGANAGRRRRQVGTDFQ